MGLYKNLEGRTVDVSDDFAKSQGFTAVTDAEHAGQLQDQALEARKADEAESAPLVFGRHALSMATLGAGDLVTAATTTDARKQEILAGEEAHPYAAMGGDVVGAIGPAFAAPGSFLAKTPAGYLSQATAHMAESGGAAAVIGAAGTEGAIQNAGQYIGHAALEDKDATVEGLAGALGTGFAFGAAGGGAALGVEKGSIAARRMFSRVMDGGKDAAITAASEWETKSKTILDADQATADAARKKLEEYRSARVAAQQEDMRASSILGDEKARAAASKGTKHAPDNSPIEMTVEGTLEKLDADAPGPRRVPKPGELASYAGPNGETQVSQTSSAKVSAKTSNVPDRVEVVQTGGTPSKPVYELRTTRNGVAENRPITKDELISEAEKALPDGYRLGADINPRQPYTITRGVPEPAEVAKNGLYIVRPSELAQRGIQGNEISVEHLASVKNAHGVKLDPVQIDIHNGKFYVEDGNHRLFSAAQNGDSEVAVSFRQRGDDWKPQANSRDISSRLAKQSDSGIALDDYVEPKSVDGISIDRQVAEFKRRLAAGEDLRGLNPNESISAFRTRKGTEKLEGMPRTLDIPQPEAPGGEMQWVNRQQSVAGLKNVRDTFGKLTRQEGPVFGKVIDAENAKLEAALLEFEDARKTLMERIQTPEAHNFTPPARGMPDEHLAVPLDHARGVSPSRTPLKPGDYEFLRGETNGQRSLGAEDKTNVGKTPNKQKLRQLDDAHEAALEKAHNAATDAERESAMSEAKLLEQQLGTESMPDNLVGDVAKAAEAFGRYEKASAELADIVGDAAHPVSKEASKAWQEANDESVRRTMDRIARASDDAETFGAERLSAKERVAHAKGYKAETSTNLSKAREAEFGAKEESRAANKQLSNSKKQLMAEKPKTAGKPAKGAAEAAGIYEMIDIPGMPKVGDLPVVGPLLSAWLKYRAVKAAIGRFTGRIPATADARVAALASKTKDKVATSIDRALGVVEKAAVKSRKPLASVTTTLGREIHNIGEQHKKDADVREMAALRIRELAAYVTTPGAIEQDVRRELRDVTDPDIIAAAEKHRRAGFQYLLDNAPKLPPEEMLAKTKIIPSAGEALSFGRRLEVWHDPHSAFEATENGTLTKEAADTLRATFPRLFELAQKRLLMQAGTLKEDVPYRTRVMMSMLYDVPLDRSLDPRNIRIVQESFKPTGGAAPAGTPPMSPPTPSLAGDVALNALYQTASDRSSLRR